MPVNLFGIQPVPTINTAAIRAEDLAGPVAVDFTGVPHWVHDAETSTWRDPGTARLHGWCWVYDAGNTDECDDAPQHEDRFALLRVALDKDPNADTLGDYFVLVHGIQPVTVQLPPQ